MTRHNGRPEISDMIKEDGTLQMFAFPGGHPILYNDGDNSVLCPKCATMSLDDEVESFRPVDWFIHYEGPPEHCEECNVEIESAYGDPFKENI